MTHYATTDETGRICATTDAEEYAQGMEPFDFPDGFDFSRQWEYRIVGDGLVHDPPPPSEEELAARAETERRSQLEAAALMFVRTAALTDEQALSVSLLFEDWEPGTGYEVGDRRRSDGRLWRCLQAHTSQAGWEPQSTPALWAETAEPGTVPEWKPPAGSHDAYAKGDRVTHNGKTWVSDVDANNWEPGVYGWTETEG